MDDNNVPTAKLRKTIIATNNNTNTLKEIIPQYPPLIMIVSQI